jgi:hypothetical protein
MIYGLFLSPFSLFSSFCLSVPDFTQISGDYWHKDDLMMIPQKLKSIKNNKWEISIVLKEIHEDY